MRPCECLPGDWHLGQTEAAAAAGRGAEGEADVWPTQDGHHALIAAHVDRTQPHQHVDDRGEIPTPARHTQQTIHVTTSKVINVSGFSLR